jgi:Protein of unknown function (DUF3135)
MKLHSEDTKAIIERLSGLYQTDPVEFERLSRALIKNTIDNFPESHQKRARGLQFKLDCVLSKYHDPVARMNKMIEIFWENFQHFHDAFHNPEKLLHEREHSQRPAKVISLSAHLAAARDERVRH